MSTADLVPEAFELAEIELPRLLRSEEGWRSLFVDDEYPHVERLWRPFRFGRLFLHRIHPLPDDPEAGALWHPHPWPSAVKIVRGAYETAINYGHPINEVPPVGPHFVVRQGTMYTMLEDDEWHFVSPCKWAHPYVLSIMFAGQPFESSTRLRKNPDLRALDPQEARALQAEFRALYPWNPLRWVVQRAGFELRRLVRKWFNRTKAPTPLQLPPSNYQRCETCLQEIDPDTCICGEPMEYHEAEHYARPMGCECCRPPTTKVRPRY